MDTLCQTRVIPRIASTGNNALVRLALSMQAFEIRMVVGQHGSLVGRGFDENLRIVNAMAGPARVLDCQHVVAQGGAALAQPAEGNLIRIESGHAWSVGLVVADVRIDLVGMFCKVVPGRMKVFCGQPHDAL